MFRYIFCIFIFGFQILNARTTPYENDLVQLAQVVKNNSKNLFFTNTMPEGPYKGEALDVSERRPLVVLKKDSTHWVVANFHHLEKFYFASVPISGVEKTYFQLVKFLPIAAHSMMRFQMKKNDKITLLAEIPNGEELEKGNYFIKLKEPMYLEDAILSIESTWTVGRGGYSLLRGVQDHYVNTYRLMSVATVARTYYGNESAPTEQYLFNFTSEESSKILSTAIESSESKDQRILYNTFNQNCSTLLFELLNSSLDLDKRKQVSEPTFKEKVFQFAYHNFGFLHFYPVVAKYVAIWGRFRDENSQAVNLEDEPLYKSIFQKEKETYDSSKKLERNSSVL